MSRSTRNGLCAKELWTHLLLDDHKEPIGWSVRRALAIRIRPNIYGFRHISEGEVDRRLEFLSSMSWFDVMSRLTIAYGVGE